MVCPSNSKRYSLSLCISFLPIVPVMLMTLFFVEPTSALDATTSELVERTLVKEVKDPEKNLKAIIWITHSEEQALRVATRTIQLTPTGVEEELIPDV